MDSEQERTEQATPKRRQDARKKGDVAKSSDLVAACSLLAAIVFFTAASKSNAEYASNLMHDSLSQDFLLQTDVQTFVSSLSRNILEALGKLAMFFAAIVLTPIAVNLSQSGFLFLPDKCAPQISRINPLKNIAKLFSFETLGQIFFGCVKLTCLVLILFISFRRDLETLVSLPNGEPLSIALFALNFLKRLVFVLCAALLLLAVVDYTIKRVQWERRLRMTPQELREEMKEESGDPQIKGKRRAMRSSVLNSVTPPEPPNPASSVSRYNNAAQDRSRDSRLKNDSNS